jgi:hypothetical protein
LGSGNVAILVTLESSAQGRSDRTVPNESLGFGNVVTLLTVESSAQGRSDRTVSSESLAQLQSDGISPISSSGQLLPNTVLVLETLAYTTYTEALNDPWSSGFGIGFGPNSGNAVLEVLGFTYVEDRTPIEWQGVGTNVVYDSISPIELATQTKSDVIALLEGSGQPQSNILLQSESLKAAQYDSLLPTEWTAQTKPDFATFTERSGQLQSDAFYASEHLLPLRQDTQLQGETLGTTHYDNRIRIEWAGAAVTTVSCDESAPIEWLTEVAPATDSFTETISNLRFDLSYAAEQLKAAYVMLQSPAERTGATTADILTGIEITAQTTRIVYDANLPIEWLQTARLVTAFPLEFQLGMVSLIAVPIGWDGQGSKFIFPRPPSPAGYVIPWLSGPGTFVSGVVNISTGLYPIPWI